MSDIKPDFVSTNHPRYKVTLCPPDLKRLQRVKNGEIADATYIIQNYVANGLESLKNSVDFLGPITLGEFAFTSDLDHLSPAPRTWTKSFIFEITSKISWRFQQLLRIPYLNIFTNLKLLDASLRCLPGHDLVYERNSLYRFGISMACKRLKMPYILYIEADDILEHEIMGKPIQGLLRFQAERAARYNLMTANCVVCVSDPLKRHLIEKWHIPAEKIFVFSNVADVRKFTPDPQVKSEVRKSLGLDNEILILFLGNFYIWHDISTLLNAFKQVHERFPAVRLMLIGDGVTRDSMMQLAERLKIEDAVHFTGMVAHTEVPRNLAAADIAIVPYPKLDQEVWLSPLKLFEYMASGNAIVASNVGQLPEWISDGKNGLLVPPEDISALAGAIERLIEDENLRLRLGQQAREDALRSHSWDQYMNRLDRIFSAVINRKTISNL